MSQETEENPVTPMDATPQEKEGNPLPAPDEMVWEKEKKENTVVPMEVELPEAKDNPVAPMEAMSEETVVNPGQTPMDSMAQENEENVQNGVDTGTTETTNATETIEDVPTSVVMVEQPNTIIELVDLYVPPVHSVAPSQVIFVNSEAVRPQHQIMFIPSHMQQIPQQAILWGSNPTLLYTEPTQPSSSDESAPSKGTRGRRRGRRATTPRPRATKRGRRAETPPPLPPPPNFLEHCINPLENEIYPKVIVQPAHQPWVLPRDLLQDAPPKVEPKQEAVPIPVSGSVVTATTQSAPVISQAQVRQNLQLFGPNVAIMQLNTPGSLRFQAVLREANGNQRQMFFTAQQLVSFGATYMAQMASSAPKSCPAPRSQFLPGSGASQQVQQLNQRPVFKTPASLFKIPTVRPPRAPIVSRAPPVSSFVAPPPPPPATPTATTVDIAPAGGSLAKEVPPAVPPPAVPPPAVPPPAMPPPVVPPPMTPPMTTGFALPSILKHKSQMKLLNTLQNQRAKAKRAAEAAEAERNLQALKLAQDKNKDKDEKKEIT
ncbi:SH3 domain-containing protein C23A1.17 [Drosophila rhopaloa]|uniref:SH3 domain-containing protein C23A1.17 n=1 Tax=Drosophila rhopaloa TaxID=1041015 RepID=A0A6P4EK56_DRORH|nr:SH3 domain-containing protein C23A1.17 [Drosophila rhopaloa]